MIENPSRHPLFRLWVNIVHQCHNPQHAAYHLYGANGATVCDRWRNSFEAFTQDVEREIGDRPKGQGFTRIDLTKPYEPRNIRWMHRGEWLSRPLKDAPPGHKSRRARFSPDQIRAIRQDTRKQRIIAQEFGTTGPVISRIKAGISYKRVE